IPDFVGRYFPKRQQEGNNDFFYASMLLLLKPWRNASVDLKGTTETWENAYSTFMATTSQHNKDIVEGIQFFHSCQHAAKMALETEEQEIIAAAERAAQMEENMEE
ncbi:hypothetical protein BDP27DRAFT_1182467, partial [Rhodocollybia butyracea]